MAQQANGQVKANGQAQAKGGAGQVVTLIVLAVVLGAAYVALDFYSDGEKNKSITESRGTQISQALSRFRQDSSAYPDSLDKLVPKFSPALQKCPGGEAFAYQSAGGEYTLTCPNVAWKSRPYSFSSRTRTWQE
jgi:hypothetical protein